MSSPHHTLYFHILETAALAICAAGCAIHIAFWLTGEKGEGPVLRRAGLVLRELLARLRTRDGLRAVFLEGLLQNRLRRVSPGRWATHFILLGGFLLLFFIGSLGDWLTDRGLWAVQKDTPWFAVINELSGLLLLGGAFVAWLRRYVLPQGVPGVRTWRDGLPGLWLIVLVITGYLVEGARIASGRNGVAFVNPNDLRCSFIGEQAAVVWQALGLTSAQSFQTVWWLHALLSLSFVAYLPFSPLFHLFTAPLSVLFNSPRQHEREMSGTLVSEIDGSVGRFIQRVQLDACTRCGECARWCEAASVRPVVATSPSCRLRKLQSWKKSETLPSLLARLIDGKPFDAESLTGFANDVYQCTLCARCVEACPVKIDLLGLWLSLRSEVAQRGLTPANLGAIKEALAAERNIVNYPNADRDLWVDYVEEAPQDRWQKEHAEVLYFVGCMSSFSPAAQNIPMAFAEVMLHAGLDFALLGGEEWCCGFPLLAAGMEGPMFDDLREHNIERLSALGANTIVFSCPSCYQTWMRHYRPHLPESVALYHSTQFLVRLTHENRLRLKPLDITVTYHDPCDLGRNSGVYEEPRAILQALPGVDLREPRWNRAQAHCCGGGGDLEAVDAELANTIGSRTFQTLEATGADTICVACPQCKRMLQGAARTVKSKTGVVDIVELVREAMEGAT